MMKTIMAIIKTLNFQLANVMETVTVWLFMNINHFNRSAISSFHCFSSLFIPAIHLLVNYSKCIQRHAAHLKCVYFICNIKCDDIISQIYFSLCVCVCPIVKSLLKCRVLECWVHRKYIYGCEEMKFVQWMLRDQQQQHTQYWIGKKNLNTR